MTGEPIELGINCELVSGAVANDVDPSSDPLSFPLQEMVGFTIDQSDGVATASLDVDEGLPIRRLQRDGHPERVQFAGDERLNLVGPLTRVLGVLH